MISKQIKLKIIYFLFVFIAILTIIPIIFYFIGYEFIWTIYAYFYFFSIFIYLWYRFILLAYEDLKGEKWGVNLYTPFTVVIPCFNENPELLEKCIESVEKAKGDKKVLIIDDGSTNDVWETITKLLSKYDNLVAKRFEKNAGKRKALHWAFNNVETKFLITIDSDTVIEKYAFAYLLAPFVEQNIGATTGNIRLINEKRNFLTRIIAGLYLSGLDNYKKAQSVLGNVICCSGCLSAYRTEILTQIKDPFLNQIFLGKFAAHSEDRHLTNLILEKGFKVVYVKDALCYTETPQTLWKFLKQQQRWKRGFVRESIYLLSFSFGRSKTLFIEATIGSAIPFFLSFGIQIMILAYLLINPLYVINYILPGWVVFMTIRELPIFLRDPKRAVWFYFYIPLYELLLWWQNLIAVFTVNNKGWLTR